MEMRRKNIEEVSSNGGSWRNGSIKLEEDNDQPRPPTYNPEDYAAALKKFSRRATEPKDESGAPQSGGADGEMSLRQFTGIPELLNKLKTDLRVAYPSFVQEFIGDPLDGVTLLLEMLKTIQQSQSNNQGRASSALQRRILLDEHSCLLCLKHSLRCQDAPRRFASSPAGLFTLAVCFMSNANKSRILALELLTRVCEHPGAEGHVPVSEAMSTMRLRFGEPVRFRFLVGMLNGACPDLISSGLKFINAFVETSPNLQTKFYIQAELDQAGFKIDSLKKFLPSSEIIDIEIARWERNYIDVESMIIKSEEALKEVVSLREKVGQLENTITMLQEEKLKQMAVEKHYRKNLKDLDKHHSLKYETDKSTSHICVDDTKLVTSGRRLENGDVTPAEDEGISSSEHEDIEIEERVPVIYELLTMQNDTIAFGKKGGGSSDDDGNGNDATIDEVMSDFQKIINDVEKQNNSRLSSKPPRHDQRFGDKNQIKGVFNHQNDRIIIRNFSDDSKSAENGNNRSEALILEDEVDIVPSYILPQPPSRSRSLYLPEKDYDDINPFFDDEDDDDRTESLLNSTINLDADFNEDNLIDNIENVNTNKYHMENNRNKITYKSSDSYNYFMYDKNNSKSEEVYEKNNKNDKKTKKLVNGENGRAKIKRSDTFHNIHNEIQQKFYDVSLMINRRGSFDGLFYNNKPTRNENQKSAARTSKSSASSAIADQDNKKLKSKSLDRIEAGIERFIDIVVTSDDKVYDDSSSPMNNEKRTNKTDWGRKNGGNSKKKPFTTTNKNKLEKPIYFNDLMTSGGRSESNPRIGNVSSKNDDSSREDQRKEKVYTNVRIDKTGKQYFGPDNKSNKHPNVSVTSMEYIMPKIYVGSNQAGPVRHPDKSRNETNQADSKYKKNPPESEFILKRGNKIAGMYSNQFHVQDYSKLPPNNKQRESIVNRFPSNLKKNISSSNSYSRSNTRLADTPSGLY